MRITRGDIWLTDFTGSVGREQGGIRPAVVMSGAAVNSVPLGLLFAAPLTTTRRDWPYHVEVSASGTGLDKPSWAMMEQLGSISVRRLQRRIGHVDDALLDRMNVVFNRLLRP
ncbi:type II toxin-antitoxin system PemK/MazF family toxin [Planotetraspora sp. GP83]|uniref:type II toxin-antitoxin system PemK/MazF family toxin n=1 Tax=Planotetraspora sp. GP83 TaxID=3156264 RepID=UPI003514995B